MHTLTETDFKSHDIRTPSDIFVPDQKKDQNEGLFIDEIDKTIGLREVYDSIIEIRDNTNSIHNFTTPTEEIIENQRTETFAVLNNNQKKEDLSNSKLESHLKYLYETIIEQKLIKDPARINNFTVLTNNQDEEDLKVDFCSKIDELFTNQQKKILATFVKKIGQPILLDDNSKVLGRIKELNQINNDLKTIVGIPITDASEDIGVVIILELSNNEKLTLDEIRALNDFFNKHAPEINQLKKANSRTQDDLENIEIPAKDLADCLFRNSSNHVLRNILNPCYGWLSGSPELEDELIEIKNGLDEFEQPEVDLGFFHKDSYLNKLLSKELIDIETNPNNEFLMYLNQGFSDNGKYTTYFNKMKKSVQDLKEKFSHFKNDEKIYLYLANDQVQDKKIISDLNESIQKIYTIITESPKKIHGLLNNGSIPLATIGSSPYIPFDEVVSIKDQDGIISSNKDLLNNNNE